MQQFLNILALLACPLMMLFCMKGMFGGKKSCDKDNQQHDLSQKVDTLIQQNIELQKELDEIKSQKNAG